MSIPFDNAVGTLEAMFPEWDKETLTTLLISNSYHVERTIEMVLSMQGDLNPSTENSQPVVSLTTPKACVISSFVTYKFYLFYIFRQWKRESE